MFFLGAVIVACIAVCFWLYITGVQPMQVEKEIESIIQAGVELENAAGVWSKLQDMNEDEDSPEDIDTTETFDENLYKQGITGHLRTPF